LYHYVEMHPAKFDDSREEAKTPNQVADPKPPMVIRHEVPEEDEQGLVFPLTFIVMLLRALSWNDFLSMRAVCRSMQIATDFVCDYRWKTFLHCAFSCCDVVGEEEWSIFFPSIPVGNYRTLALEFAKVMRSCPVPVILDVPASKIRAAEKGTSYAFPWFYVCKYLGLPIPTNSCSHFHALRTLKSFIRFRTFDESSPYESLCSVEEFLKKYGATSNLMLSFITRMNPDCVPNLKASNLPLRYRSGKLADLCVTLPQVLTQSPYGRQVAFTLFINRSEGAHTFALWFSRLNANHDVVELYEDQLKSHYVHSGYVSCV